MKFILTAMALLVASTASYAEKSEPIQGKLENGLRYTLLPLHDEKGHMEIRMKVYAGAVDETDKQSGVAHMVEHLVFRGTDAHPNGLMPYLHEQKWVRGKNYNAVTTYDNTTYMLTPPSTANLDSSLDALSQMLLHAHLTQNDLNDERKIIMEEWRQGQGVGSSMSQQRSAAIRSGSRYTRSPVIGTTDSIANMPATELQQFYHTWYTPNNMQLLVVGDVQPEEAKQTIEKYFGVAKAQEMPKRDYLEPQLADRLLINKVQDPRSGVSQVAYVFRFDESKNREQTDEGRYQRLVDRLALATMMQRLRNQSEVMPKGVSNVTPRKSDIGQNTVALGIFATVEPTGLVKGLQQIFKEIERLKKFPITDAELAKQKEPLQAQLENAKKNTGDRDFSKWVETMLGTALSNKPYLTQPEIARLIEPMLNKISTAEVNQRIQEWFAAKDRIVSYQPPRDTKFDLTEAMVNQAQQDALSSEIAAPQKEKEIIPMSLENVSGKGTISAEKNFDKQHVTEWTLSNGDKVVWLKSDLAKDRTYFQAQSSAGFKAEGLGVWKSQLATQLIEQNAPLDWEIEQLKRWKEINKVSLSFKQSATKFNAEGSVENSHFADLLRLFYAYEVETKVKDGLDETKEDIARTINLQNEKNDENERMKAVSKLRFNNEVINESLPNKASLAKLTDNDLNAEWAKMMGAPTTYFIMNDIQPEEMKKLVGNFLADIPRNKRLDSTQILPIGGKNEARIAQNLEPKDDVKMWAFIPYQWQGKDAILVAVARNIATNKLKMALRDKELGVYSLRLESMLNPETDRIESELSFVANPTMTDKLVNIARDVFRSLPEQITEADVTSAKAQYVQSEKSRITDPRTWLARLVLSENKFGDPQYLEDMQHLTDDITLDRVKVMASNLFNADSEKVFITTPKAK